MKTTGDETLDRVRAVLRSEPLLGAGFRPERLALDRGGTLTIAGAAPSVAAKKRGLRAVASVQGVSAVVDRLHVAPAAPMHDHEIRAHLRRYFTQEPAFEGFAVREMHGERAANAPEFRTVAGDPSTARHGIDIEVRDGVVILNGRVPGLVSKRLAGVMTWWVPGVRDVINGLELSPPETDAPILIEEALRVILDRDPFVDAAQIRVGVRHRTVRLTGVVASDHLRAMAEQDAWCTFGVDDVINDIAVEP